MSAFSNSQTPGLNFEDVAPIPPSAPNRTDVALFVGFVRRRGESLPDSVRQWLDQQGWTSAPYRRPFEDLLDVPVPLESIAGFEALFDWRQRVADRTDGAAYLGAAVRSFFAQGGRKCYVVRVGDPWPLEAAQPERLRKIANLIPGYPNAFSPSAADRYSWSGTGHLFGLPDVSFVSIPDLADAVAMDRTRVPVRSLPPPTKEEFVECSQQLPDAQPDATVRGIGAPRCDDAGFGSWAKALSLLTEAISGGPLRNATVREMQLVAALPISDKPTAFTDAPATAFLQLAYPWTRTPGSTGLPGQLESPDGVLTGVLARNALLTGTFRSAANRHLSDVNGVYPALHRHQQQRLIECVSLFGPTPAGLRLLSDVTMSTDETYRPASVGRLIATITRAARRIGEDLAFAPSGEALWSDITHRLQALMQTLYADGALRGASAAEAYQVRCDRSTMSQNDLDNGRVIAYVQFDAAVPINTITVALTVNSGQHDIQIETEAA